MTKKELANLYGISRDTIRDLLNNRFFAQLSLLGYTKDQRILSPCVVRKFYELYGEPLKNDEL